MDNITHGKRLLDEFSAYMVEQAMSRETVKSYTGNVGRYFKWYEESFGLPLESLYRTNVRDFKSCMIIGVPLSFAVCATASKQRL